MSASTPRAQLEALRGSPALEDALKQCKFVARQYSYFYRSAAVVQCSCYNQTTTKTQPILITNDQ